MRRGKGRRALPAAWQELGREQRRAARETRRIRSVVSRRILKTAPLDPAASAKVAGLRYVNGETTPGICRVGSGKRARYVGADGRPVRDRDTLARIRRLAVPPAWTGVWICPDARGHLQATGRDARGRKQYRYHPRWREVRDEVKYGRLIAFAEAGRQRSLTARSNAETAEHAESNEFFCGFCEFCVVCPVWPIGILAVG